MANSPAFQFYPRQWLGDDKVMLMDWDARGMHLHFMCIAWQQQPPCTLPDDDRTLSRWVGSPPDWERVKTEVFQAWKLNDEGRWVQPGLLREYLKQQNLREKRSKAARARWDGDKSECKRNANAVQVECSSSSTSSSSSESVYPIEFLTFWTAYPRKKKKGDALKAWKQSAKRRPPTADLLVKLEALKASPDWLKDGGQFIPYPATWLRADGWEDEIATTTPKRATAGEQATTAGWIYDTVRAADQRANSDHPRWEEYTEAAAGYERCSAPTFEEWLEGA